MFKHITLLSQQSDKEHFIFINPRPSLKPSSITFPLENVVLQIGNASIAFRPYRSSLSAVLKSLPNIRVRKYSIFIINMKQNIGYLYIKFDLPISILYEYHADTYLCFWHILHKQNQ